MIKISDLNRIKEACFDNIARKTLSSDRVLLEVSFKAITDRMFSVSMSNRLDYARGVFTSEKPFNFEHFTISWYNFGQLCFLMYDEVDVKFDKNSVVFYRQDRKYKAPLMYNELPEHSYKFNFENAILLNMDNSIILKEHNILKFFVATKNYVISFDEYFCILNKTKYDIGDQVLKLTEKFPQGTWFFNPENKIIVSEDKSIARSFRQAQGPYPLQALFNVIKQPLSNWFICDKVALSKILEKGQNIARTVTIEFQENSLTLISSNTTGETFKDEIEVKYKEPPKRKMLKMQYSYFKFFTEAAQNKKIKIEFDDNENTRFIRAENEKVLFFLPACI